MNDNKVIAEFMGLETIDRCYFEHLTKEGNRELTHHILLKYHTSWDWLMPVVGKLLDLDEPASVSDHRYRLKDALVETNIDSMYDMAVEFIKKHNDTVGDTNTMNSINITFGTKLTKDKFTSAMQRSIHHLDGVSWKVNSSKTIDKRAIVLKAIVNRYEGLANLIPQLQEDSDVAYVNIADDIDDILNENQIEEIINELITQNYEH